MSLSTPQIKLAQSLTTVYPPPQGREALVTKAFKGSLKSIPPLIKVYMQAIVAAAQGQIGLLEAVEASMQGHLEARDFMALAKDLSALEALGARASQQANKVFTVLTATKDLVEVEKKLTSAVAKISDLTKASIPAPKRKGKKPTREPSQRTMNARADSMHEASVQRNKATREEARLKGVITQNAKLGKQETTWEGAGVWEAAISVPLRERSVKQLRQERVTWGKLATRVEGQAKKVRAVLTAHEKLLQAQTDVAKSAAESSAKVSFRDLCEKAMVTQRQDELEEALARESNEVVSGKRKAEEKLVASTSSDRKVRKRNPKRAGSAAKGAR